MSARPAGPARYPIRAVSKLTGIAIDTLRAWERRYGAVTPIRDERGRMYTDADVARLRLLGGAVESGHSIGRLAGLSNEELRDLCGTTADTVAESTAVPGRMRLDTTALITALREYDAVGLDQELSRLAATLSKCCRKGSPPWSGNAASSSRAASASASPLHAPS